MGKLIRAEVAAIFGKNQETIRRWIETKGFPAPDTAGIPHLWEADEVIAWAKRTKTPYIPQFAAE